MQKHTLISIRQRSARWIISLLLAALLTIMTGCGGENNTEPAPEQQELSRLEMTSPAFDTGGTIPQKYTCDGSDLSPPLRWDAPPPGTQSLALIVDDPDAPAGTWVHWVLYDLPTDQRELSENSNAVGTRGKNDFGELGYGGPCPPAGTPHRYFFKLYALDIPLNLPAGATRGEVLDAMSGHVLAEGELVGRYSR